MIRHRIRIPTSDHVELEFELAGVGSRFAAFQIDFFILFFSLLALWIGGVFGTARLLPGEHALSWSVGLLIVLSFVVFWGYFLFFEALLRGRTPGKLVMGLRVLRDDGIPVGVRGAAIRNLLRLADLLPPPSGLLGGVVVLFNPLGKRLGDMAAGTIVIRERFVKGAETDSGALFMERLEKGGPRQAVLLPGGSIEVTQLALVERFLRRRATLPDKQRQSLAWKIAEPLLPLMSEDPAQWEHSFDREARAEDLLERILGLAQGVADSSSPATREIWFASQKRQHWQQFSRKVGRLWLGGRRALRRLSPESLSRLLDDYRRIAADLARARSLGADPLTVDQINRLAVQGHNLIYGHSPPRHRSRLAPGSWLTAFPRTLRRHPAAFLLSMLLLGVPFLAGYLSVQLNPELGYGLVPPVFLEFSPARQESLHEIPSLIRPIAASAILTNNVQVSLAAFSLGLTAGVGTVAVMINNGLHIGAIAGWLTRAGQQRALWGWIMPHGGTELLAIVIAGMAGLLLAEAILSPGRSSRREALKKNALDALILELGCMAMLVAAGLIEGFVSPSQLAYPGRIAVLVGSLLFWGAYLGLAGRSPDREGISQSIPT